MSTAREQRLLNRAQNRAQGGQVTRRRTSPRTSEMESTSNVSNNKDHLKLFLGGKSPKTTMRNDEEIMSNAVVCNQEERSEMRKEDRKAYQKLQENCEKGLPIKFTLQKMIDFQAKTDQLKEITSVMQNVEALRTALVKRDMISVFKIPSNFERNENGEWEPSSEAKTLNLITDYKDISIETVKKAVSWFLRYGQDYHVENVKWSGEMILNSCEETLRNKLNESTAFLDESQKGGPVYFSIMMNHIIATSNVALRGIINRLQSLKLTEFDGENVKQWASFVRGALTLLKDQKMTPVDIKDIIMRSLLSTSCEEFKVDIQQLKSLIQMNMVEKSTDEILLHVEELYNNLIGSGRWTPKSLEKHQGSTFHAESEGNSNDKKVICLNCGGIGHMVNTCKQPIDDSAIAIRKEIMFKSDDVTKNQQRTSNKHPSRIPPKEGESEEKQVKGTSLFWCGKCKRWNKSHRTSEHKSKEELTQSQQGRNVSQDTESTANTVIHSNGFGALNF
jgi:uncharacterized protein Smg (DUF494 family)